MSSSPIYHSAPPPPPFSVFSLFSDNGPSMATVRTVDPWELIEALRDIKTAKSALLTIQEKDIERLKALRLEDEETIKKATGQIDDKSYIIADLKDSLTTVNTQLDYWRDVAKDLNEEKDRLNALVKDKKDIIDNLEEQIWDFEDKCHTLGTAEEHDKEEASEITSHDDEVAAQISEIASQAKQIQRLNIVIDKQDGDIKAKDQAIAHLSSICQSDNERFWRERDITKTLNKEKDTLNASIKHKNRKIDDLEAKIWDMEKESQKLVAAQGRDEAGASKAASSYKKTIDQAEEIELLQTLRAADNDAVSFCQRTIISLDDEIKALKDKLKERLNKGSLHSKNELYEAKANYDRKDATIAKLEKDLAALQAWKSPIPGSYGDNEVESLKSGKLKEKAKTHENSRGFFTLSRPMPTVKKDYTRLSTSSVADDGGEMTPDSSKIMHDEGTDDWAGRDGRSWETSERNDVSHEDHAGWNPVEGHDQTTNQGGYRGSVKNYNDGWY